MENTNKGMKRMVKILAYEAYCSPAFFAIREDDYLVLIQMVFGSGTLTFGDPGLQSDIDRLKTNDKEQRVCELRLSSCFFSGRPLPTLAGDLTGLVSLDLRGLGITSLPPTIGKLSNLRRFYLYQTTQLRELPEEFGDLVRLEELYLNSSGISCLPCSIGGLENLETLSLVRTKNIFELPEEIGDLASLCTLLLSESKIRMLPRSIGRLCNLTELEMSETKLLVGLPEEIGGLANLDELSLEYSGITSLPKSIRNLTGLSSLYISGARISELQEDRRNFLLMLVQSIPSLYYMGYDIERESKKLNYALSVNLARSRTGFRPVTKNNNHVPMIPKLWPMMFRNASNPFDRNYRYMHKISRPEYIFQLLVDGRESFLGLLIHRCSDPTWRWEPFWSFTH